MEFINEYGLFLAKSITVVAAILIIVSGVVALSSRSTLKTKEHIEVKHLNRAFEEMSLALQEVILPKKAFKGLLKKAKKQQKSAEQQSDEQRKLFVLNFHGDIRASAVASLREEITALLMIAAPRDEVVVRLESAGGLVHAYGLAASQLARIKERKIGLTVAVDKVAASGGYLMACVADRIVTAPFAVVGSIGVVSQLPNFNRLLKKHDIDFELLTAGEYKRTMTLFGENTDKARLKFQEELEETHRLFKEFLSTYRNQLDLERVATGEHWYGTQALELKLVDELRTSDDYLLEASKDAALFEITYASHKPLWTKLSNWVSAMLVRQFFEPRV
ncbi:MAG: protease SohB [Candidatus Competibacteraceae bacterium]|jgi:serine protease SohB|nr:protease SohB [Candidatus Competibacteraceae bacterium]